MTGAPLLTVDLGNTSGSLCLAIETAARLINTSVSTLVACSAGMSRSPAIVAAALALVRGQSPDDALVELVAQIPHDVSPRLWGDIKDAHE